MSKGTTTAITESFMELLRERTLDKITVKEIIESAEINRNTFYYHYHDIYDLLEKIFQEESFRYRNDPDAGSTFYEEFVRLASFLQDHKDAILHVHHSRAQKVLIGYLEETVEHFIRRFVKIAAEGSELSVEGEEYITCFYTYGIVALTIRWIEADMPDYRKELIHTTSESFEATIDDMIRVYIAGHKEECGQNN